MRRDPRDVGASVGGVVGGRGGRAPRNAASAELRDAVMAADAVLSAADAPLASVASAVSTLRAALARSSPPGALGSAVAVLEATVVPRLLTLVGSYLDACVAGSVSVQAATIAFDALWALTNLGAGDSVLARTLLKCGAVQVAVRAVRDAAHDELIENAVWLLGNIAGDGAAGRADVVKAGALEATAVRAACELSRLGYYPFGTAHRDVPDMSPGADESLDASPPTLVASAGLFSTSIRPTAATSAVLRICAWGLSNMVEGCSEAGAPTLELVPMLLPVLNVLLDSSDPDVLAHASWALSHICDGVPLHIDAVLSALKAHIEPLSFWASPQADGGAAGLASLPAVGNAPKWDARVVGSWAIACFSPAHDAENVRVQSPPVMTRAGLRETWAAGAAYVLLDDRGSSSKRNVGSGVGAGGDGRGNRDFALPCTAAKLTRLLRHQMHSVAKPALRCVGNIVCAEDEKDFTQAVCELRAVSALRLLLNSPARDMLKEAAWTMSNVAAGSTPQIQEVLDSGCLPRVLALATEPGVDAGVRTEASWVVLNSTSCGTERQIEQLVRAGAVGVLCALLSDTTMAQMAIEGLDKISSIAERIAAGSASVLAAKKLTAASAPAVAGGAALAAAYARGSALPIPAALLASAGSAALGAAPPASGAVAIGRATLGSLSSTYPLATPVALQCTNALAASLSSALCSVMGGSLRESAAASAAAAAAVAVEADETAAASSIESPSATFLATARIAARSAAPFGENCANDEIVLSDSRALIEALRCDLVSRQLSIANGPMGMRSGAIASGAAGGGRGGTSGGDKTRVGSGNGGVGSDGAASMVSSFAEGGSSISGSARRSQKLFQNHFVTCQLCRRTWSRSASITNFCPECRCEVCADCDCTVFHYSRLEQELLADEEKEKVPAAKGGKAASKKAGNREAAGTAAQIVPVAGSAPERVASAAKSKAPVTPATATAVPAPEIATASAQAAPPPAPTPADRDVDEGDEEDDDDAYWLLVNAAARGGGGGGTAKNRRAAASAVATASPKTPSAPAVPAAVPASNKTAPGGVKAIAPVQQQPPAVSAPRASKTTAPINSSQTSRSPPSAAVSPSAPAVPASASKNKFVAVSAKQPLASPPFAPAASTVNRAAAASSPPLAAAPASTASALRGTAVVAAALPPAIPPARQPAPASTAPLPTPALRPAASAVIGGGSGVMGAGGVVSAHGDSAWRGGKAGIGVVASSALPAAPPTRSSESLWAQWPGVGGGAAVDTAPASAVGAGDSAPPAWRGALPSSIRPDAEAFAPSPNYAAWAAGSVQTLPSPAFRGPPPTPLELASLLASSGGGQGGVNALLAAAVAMGGSVGGSGAGEGGETAMFSQLQSFLRAALNSAGGGIGDENKASTDGGGAIMVGSALDAGAAASSGVLGSMRGARGDSEYPSSVGLAPLPPPFIPSDGALSRGVSFGGEEESGAWTGGNGSIPYLSSSTAGGAGAVATEVTSTPGMSLGISQHLYGAVPPFLLAAAMSDASSMQQQANAAMLQSTVWGGDGSGVGANGQASSTSGGQGRNSGGTRRSLSGSAEEFGMNESHASGDSSGFGVNLRNRISIGRESPPPQKLWLPTPADDAMRDVVADEAEDEDLLASVMALGTQG